MRGSGGTGTRGSWRSSIASTAAITRPAPRNCTGTSRSPRTSTPHATATAGSSEEAMLAREGPMRPRPARKAETAKAVGTSASATTASAAVAVCTGAPPCTAWAAANAPAAPVATSVDSASGSARSRRAAEAST